MTTNTATAGGAFEARVTWRDRLRWKLFPSPIGRPLISNDPRTFLTTEIHTTLDWKDRLRALVGGKLRVTVVNYTDVEVKEANGHVRGLVSMNPHKERRNNVTIPVRQAERQAFLEAVEQLPDEAFGWVVVAASRSIYPDGLGGFREDSRKGIERLKKEALAYMEAFKG